MVLSWSSGRDNVQDSLMYTASKQAIVGFCNDRGEVFLSRLHSISPLPKIHILRPSPYGHFQVLNGVILAQHDNLHIASSRT